MSESSEKRSFDSAREEIGAVYAKGLLGATEGQAATDRVLAELNSLVDDILDRMPDFEHLLASPRIGLTEKNRILDQAFDSRMHPLLLNFLKVVARHGRLDCLRQIRSGAKQLYNELRGRVQVMVHTVNAVDDPTLRQIQDQLTLALGRQVELASDVDPSLLGGLVVRVGDTVFDGSLDNRLERMRSETMSNTSLLIRDSLGRFLETD
jgi:F-type H+-transporting ATPase subunit delta